MAERVGFEPTIPVKVCPLSRRIVSTTHAPLRVKKIGLRPVVSDRMPSFFLTCRRSRFSYARTRPVLSF